MIIEAIRPEKFTYFPYQDFTFSLGRSDGISAWVSGHSGAVWDPALSKMAISGGMGEQSEVMYEKIAVILDGAGMTMADVVHVTENVTIAGLSSYGEAEAVRRTVFAGTEPALSTVVVDRLVRRAALIEVQVTARRGGSTPVLAGPAVSGPAVSGHRAADDGSVVYLPTILPLDAGGAIVAQGDFRGQYRYCLEQAGQLLDGAGLSLADVVQTVDYSTPATRHRYQASHRVRRELLGPVYPTAAGILVSQLHQPGVLVALDVIASREPLEVVNLGWSRYETLSYSPAVKAGHSLYMSGFAALSLDTQEALFPGDLAGQARYTYSTILELLASAGAGPRDLISTLEFVTPAGVPDYRAVAAVRHELLTSPYPASVGAVCAGLLRPEFLLEVIPFAILPS